MSSSIALCPRCEFRVLVRSVLPSWSPWHLRRTMAMAVRQSRSKKPGRMTLSPNVERSPTDVDAIRSRDSGPFGGMNRTSADLPPRTLRSPQRAARASTTNSSHKPGPVKKNKDERPLFHALKMQTALTPLSYNARYKLKDQLDKISSFDELGLRPDVAEAIGTQALPTMSILTPTPAQKLAIPALLSRKGHFEKSRKSSPSKEYAQFLIAAETGSGKTLAYLLPIIDSIKRQEDTEKTEKAAREEKEAKEREQKEKENVFATEPPELADAINPDSATGRPRALILLPSSELVTQVGKVVKTMSHTIKYRSAPISSANTPAVIKSRLFNPNGIDIVISTPHLLYSIAQKEPNILRRVNYIVVDEADSLFDRSFKDTTCDIIDRAAPSLKQLILCSATIPRSLDKFIDNRFPTMQRLVTPKLHSIPRRVQLGAVDIDREPYRGNRDLACADVIWQLGKAVHDDTGYHHTMKHILVFVNEREQAEAVAQFLSSKGIDASPLTRDTSETRLTDVLSSFTSPGRVDGDIKQDTKPGRDFVPFDGAMDDKPSAPFSRRLENTKVLVTTDLGSRGIDTLAVRHAVLYDVPHTTIDFVHRLGRLGRMNRRGRAVVLVGKKDRKDIVREVREAMFKGQALI